MRSLECVGRVADAMFFSLITTCNSFGNEEPFCGRYAVFEGDVQSIEREKLNPNRLKLLLLQRHILDVSELVAPT